MPWLMGGVGAIAGFLLVFFTAFNVLEATLPTLVSKLAGASGRGTAIGVFASIQFFGTFLGAAAGGYLYGRWGATGVVIFDTALLVMWLMVALGTRVPGQDSTRC